MELNETLPVVETPVVGPVTEEQIVPVEPIIEPVVPTEANPETPVVSETL